MEKIGEQLKRYRWLLISGIIVAILMGTLMANIHVVKFISFRMKGDTKSIISLLNKDIHNKARQDDWYFVQGIDYLIKDATQDSLNFLEENLQSFALQTQYDIIQGYNIKGLLFLKQTSVIQLIMQHLDHKVLQDYLKRIDAKTLDEELFRYFGNEPEMNADFVNVLSKILTVYPNQLPLEQFKFNVYTLLAMDGSELETKKDQIFSKLNPERTKNILFKALKTKPIEVNVLSEWIEFLDKYKILTPEEYSSFSRIYSEIQVVQSRRKNLDEKEVDFLNKKQEIELEIGDSLKLLEIKLTQINTLKYEITSLEKELEQLTDYAYMTFYIDKDYGDSEYEASVPRKSIFGNYKASSQKYIIKLSTTTFYKEGVYYVDVYLNGTKMNSKGEEYPYYIEVPKENLERIEMLKRSRNLKLQEVGELDKETANMKAQVDVIKNETGYNQNEIELNDIAIEREDLIKKIESKIVEIKNLFGIGNVTISDV